MMFNVLLGYDSEADVWLTKCSNVPGLVVEARRLEDAIEQSVALTPVLVQANIGISPEERDMSIELVVYRDGQLVHNEQRAVEAVGRLASTSPVRSAAVTSW